MADLTLIVEDGSGVTGANTYVTLEEADQINGERVHARDWEGFDELHRTRALLTAYEVLGQLNWYVSPIASGTVASLIKRIQARLARRLAQRDRLEGLDQAPVVGASNAGRSRSLQTGHPSSSSAIPDEVRNMIGPLVNWHSVPLVRVA